jgi:hypothetical protein
MRIVSIELWDVSAYGEARQHCSRTIGTQRRLRHAATMLATERYSICDEYCHFNSPLLLQHYLLQECNPRPVQFRPGRAGLVATLIACYNHIKLWSNGLHHWKSKRRVCPGPPTLPSLHIPCLCPAWVAGGHRVVESMPSPRCRGRVSRAWKTRTGLQVCGGGCGVQKRRMCGAG